MQLCGNTPESSDAVMMMIIIEVMMMMMKMMIMMMMMVMMMMILMRSHLNYLIRNYCSTYDRVHKNYNV